MEEARRFHVEGDLSPDEDILDARSLCQVSGHFSGFSRIASSETRGGAWLYQLRRKGLERRNAACGDERMDGSVRRQADDR
jgi:hypothetical protein